MVINEIKIETYDQENRKNVIKIAIIFAWTILRQ